MRIFVVGGTGLIGARVVERLATEHDVTVLHRGKHAPPLPASVRRMIGDRDRLAEYAAEFRQWSPNVVLDMISGDEHQARAVVETVHGIARSLVTVWGGPGTHPARCSRPVPVVRKPGCRSVPPHGHLRSLPPSAGSWHGPMEGDGARPTGDTWAGSPVSPMSSPRGVRLAAPLLG